MRWTIGLLTVITLTLTWSQLMTVSAAQQKQPSMSGAESLTSPSPSDVGGTSSNTAGSSTTATAKANPTTSTTTGMPTTNNAKAQQPSPTPGSLASSLLSGISMHFTTCCAVFVFGILSVWNLAFLSVSGKRFYLRLLISESRVRVRSFPRPG